MPMGVPLEVGIAFRDRAGGCDSPDFPYGFAKPNGIVRTRYNALQGLLLDVGVANSVMTPAVVMRPFFPASLVAP